MRFQHRHERKYYVTNPKSKILEVYEFLQIIFIKHDMLRIFNQIYDASHCEITVYNIFRCWKNIVDQGIEPANYVWTNFSEIFGAKLTGNWIFR